MNTQVTTNLSQFSNSLSQVVPLEIPSLAEAGPSTPPEILLTQEGVELIRNLWEPVTILLLRISNATRNGEVSLGPFVYKDFGYHLASACSKITRELFNNSMAYFLTVPDQKKVIFQWKTFAQGLISMTQVDLEYYLERPRELLKEGLLTAQYLQGKEQPLNDTLRRLLSAGLQKRDAYKAKCTNTKH